MENAFVAIVPTRPCPLFGRPVHRRDGSHRFRPGASPQTLRIPPHGGHPALSDSHRSQRDVTPAFGYGALHPSTSGTSTHLSTSLPSAHYGPFGLPLCRARFRRWLIRAALPRPGPHRRASRVPFHSLSACCAPYPAETCGVISGLRPRRRGLRRGMSGSALGL